MNPVWYIFGLLGALATMFSTIFFAGVPLGIFWDPWALGFLLVVSTLILAAVHPVSRWKRYWALIWGGAAQNDKELRQSSQACALWVKSIATASLTGGLIRLVAALGDLTDDQIFARGIAGVFLMFFYGALLIVLVGLPYWSFLSRRLDRNTKEDGQNA